MASLSPLWPHHPELTEPSKFFKSEGAPGPAGRPNPHESLSCATARDAKPLPLRVDILSLLTLYGDDQPSPNRFGNVAQHLDNGLRSEQAKKTGATARCIWQCRVYIGELTVNLSRAG